jgi:hypothetical protein
MAMICRCWLRGRVTALALGVGFGVMGRVRGRSRWAIITSLGRWVPEIITCNYIKDIRKD